MTIKPLLINAFETALNKYLHLDEDIDLFLQPLTGKVIAITLLPFNETIYLCPTAQRIQIMDQYAETADTTLKGSLPAFGLMGLSSKPARSFFSGEVTIEGDLNLGHHFQQLFAQLDIDLEEQLSHYTGDIIAHKVGNLFRGLNDWQQESANTLKLNITEFLQDESKDLPPAPEINIFSQQVDQLKEDFDRLEARVTRLNDTLKAKQA
ncbi:ubiquinone biosynthesis accessory factor UbiJ [methanotrophic endosymbiont of Bathymodiolus puteoserpentis (Logatchev)]|jgi:ubiquinone biosynthesis protein UbiJ|uniref:ubiquinone biosynthesis accessory factor UbiJ n=1 Tax=methanotrophic endosymbiont of Bathymodiolus puteoserpentis (Logatchev) TaxID=343235 RepID=UPI0013C7EFF3|nr:SCP2 sterol-binding domain-containing protein [methanotrophic endosymbiont of Bathymodiolus puteoserpentis (Logatchev)]SHE22096.1 Protein YigP (COG3165) clustered with ubiquinone biosynthetic genes [methanotrophic endosymbiont of Bathymodiolus puteoserpentis (Logatchev)]